MSKKKPNPHCPVRGCTADRPHSDNHIVQGLVRAFGSPADMAFWARGAMVELRESICRDLQDKRLLAFHTRLRQPEELYIRVLYALFVATPEELPHILSGELPTGLTRLYNGVNEVVFEGRGPLRKDLGGFTPLDTLNDGAHASFRSFLTVLGWGKNPDNVPDKEKYCKHLQIYCDYLNYMHDAFNAGKSKADVLAGVKNMHRPLSHWRSSSSREE